MGRSNGERSVDGRCGWDEQSVGGNGSLVVEWESNSNALGAMEFAGARLSRDDSWKRLSNTLMVATLTSTASASLEQPIDVASKIVQKKKGAGNILQAMGKVVNDKGVGGLFRGNQFQLLRKVPAKAIRIMTYEWSNHLLRSFREIERVPKLPSMVENLMVSTFAGTFSVAVTYPLHLLQVFHSKGLCFSTIQRAGIYRGVTPLCISTIPNVAVELFAYNAMRDHHGQQETNLAGMLAMSLAATMVGQTFAQPFKNISKMIAVAETRNMQTCVSSIIQKSGPLGLFKGMQYKYMKTLVSFMMLKAAALQMSRMDS